MFCASSLLSSNIAQRIISHGLLSLWVYVRWLDKIKQSMTKHRAGQPQRVVLSHITSTSPGAVESIPSRLNRSEISWCSVLPSGRQAHLLQGKQVPRGCNYILTSYRNTVVFPCFPHHPTAVLVPLPACRRSAEVSLWVKELRSFLVPSIVIYLNALFFCRLEAMTEEVSAPAITSLQQKPRENVSF